MTIEATFRDLYNKISRLEASTGSGWGNVQVAEVLTSETRLSIAYGDLTTVGPELEVDVRGTGRLLVFLAAGISSAGLAAVSFELSGANVLAATETRSAALGAAIARVGTFELLSNLEPGLTLVTLKYRGDNSATATFYNRKLFVVSI